MMRSFSCCRLSGSAGIHDRPEEKLDARVPQNKIPFVYDKLAGFYDIWGMLTESRARNRAIELADFTDRQNVLEVAVGTGLAFYEIVKRNPQGNNVGIDLSPGMLEKAKKRLRKLPTRNYSLSGGTAFNLQLETGSMDILVNNYMFDLIPFADMDKVLDEFKRVLKKGGKLILVNMTEGETTASKLYDLVYRMSPGIMGGCRGVRMTDKLIRYGFTIERREYVQQMLFPSEVIIAHA